MEILLNGTSYSVKENSTVAELLEILQLAQKRLAVEVNLNIVPRSEFPRHILMAGDRVEIVQAIGGG